MATRYEQNINAHFHPFAAAFGRWRKAGCVGSISYGQRRHISKHHVWLDDDADTTNDLFVEFDYRKLMSVNNEEELLALWDVAYAISMVTQ